MTGKSRGGASFLRRMVSMLAVGIGLTSGGAVSAQSVSPEAAPQAWVAYAGQVNTAVTTWLSSDDEAALRVRTYLDATRPAADQPSPPLALKLWFDAAGAITKVEFPTFAQEAANTDLRGLLVGRPIGAPPPKGMLLPLRLGIQLAPAPPQSSGDATSVI